MPRPRRRPVRRPTDTGAGPGAGWRVGLHQAAEYLLAFVLAGLAIHLGGPMEFELLAGAAVVAFVAASTRGPLTALRVFGIGAHRVVDPVVGTAFALLPLARLHHVSVVGILLAEAAAAVLWRLGFVRHRAPVTPAAPNREPVTPAPPAPPQGIEPDPSPPVVAPADAGRPSPAAGQATVAAAARVLGRSTARSKAARAERAEHADRLIRGSARRLGTAFGRREHQR